MVKTRVNLFERVLSSPGRVDREAGIIRSVKILGATSKNGRTYSPQALRDAGRLYEGCRVNFDHPSPATPNASRSVRDWIGELRRVRVTELGVYGDLHLISSHPHAAAVMEAAEKFPTKFGLSHNASGETRQHGGKMIVESIQSVRSVDLVQNPATNQSLFESENPVSTRQQSARLLRFARNLFEDRDLRTATKLQALKSFLEMDGMATVDTSDVDSLADPVAKLKSEIRGALRKPDTSDEDKIAAVLAIVGDEAIDPDGPPVGAEQMAESYRENRAPRRNLQERASILMEGYGGRAVHGTQHAQDRAARVSAMMARYR